MTQTSTTLFRGLVRLGHDNVMLASMGVMFGWGEVSHNITLSLPMGSPMASEAEAEDEAEADATVLGARYCGKLGGQKARDTGGDCTPRSSAKLAPLTRRRMRATAVALRSAQLTMLRLRPRRHCNRYRRASHAPRSPTRLRLRSERLWLCHPDSTRPP